MLVVLLGCSDKPDSPEAQIRARLDQAEKAAENRSLDELTDFIDEQYRDRSGRGKRDVTRLLTLYLLQNQSIHLFTRIKALSLTGPTRAQAEIVVAMAGQPIGGSGGLDLAKADLYHFDLEFIDRGGGDWKIFQAEWRQAHIGEFL
ncbi:MAG: hypothetical protein H6970_14280 [Gammaproteobacteria bacterium]|nr:hypothetical protein [Gammaproteobacteria bacterium]